MRLLLFILLVISFEALQAKTYYFSTLSGNDSRTETEAQNPATPWKTLDKLNAVISNLGAGDNLLLKRGEIFAGAIMVSKSGNAGLPIVIGAYGTGSKPVITGLVNLAGWVSLGGGIWETNCAANSMVNTVLINGQPKAIGRYPNLSAPNKGYLIPQSYSNNSQVTDNQLTYASDWTGADVVIRKGRWVLDRNLVTYQSGNTINYISESGNSPTAKFGYFMQNHPKTLDLPGEWYFNLNNKKLGIYSTSGDPSASLIQASVINALVTITSQNNIVFDNISFQGANNYAFDINYSQNVQITNCEILFSGINAVNAKNSDNLTVENSLIDRSNNIALNLENCSFATIRNNKIRNTGTIAGMGKGDSGSYEAILNNGNNNLFEKNEIDSTGYIPITFRGNSNIIRNNYISNYTLVKDDGGGIYTWNNIQGAPLTFGNKILNNVVLNAVGAGEGTDTPTYLPANGIYMDDNTANVEITGNTVANCNLYGMYIHNAHELTIQQNTLFNNRSQLVMSRDGNATYAAVRNVKLVNNIFVSKDFVQPVAEYKTPENDLAQFGTFDSNYYSRPAEDTKVINISYQGSSGYVTKSVSLDEWKASYSQDKASKNSPLKLSSSDFIRFEYNPSGTAKTVSLDDIYIDVKSNSYSGNLTLDPYTSMVLFKKKGATTDSIPPPFEGCTATGSILCERWDNIAGNDISAIPIDKTPNSSSQLTTLETANVGDAYGERIRGYLCPPVSGNYTFLIAGDDQVELWLSTDDNPANRVKIASLASWTDFHEWNKFPTQRSAPVALQAGKKYYIEVLHKEGDGGDHVTVAWQFPNGALEIPIAGSRLSPYSGTVTPPATCSATGSILHELWTNVAGTDVADIPLSQTPGIVNQINSLETANLGDLYGERIRGYICAPQNGSYSFLLSGDDGVELWLSTDDNPANKVRIAYSNGWTSYRQFDKYPSQKSAPISLQAGHKYYIEVLHKEGGGGDNVTVAWQLPDGALEIPIAGSRLSPYSGTVTPPATCSATGSILHELWTNVAGTDVANIPLLQTPAIVNQINSLETANLGDLYGERIRGYICAPQNGSYSFLLSGDDGVELWLSTDDNPANKVRIAYSTGWTSYRQFDKYPSQKSAPVSMQAGQKYYIEVLHKEGGGGDNVTVAWQLPDGSTELPIPGNRLSPVQVPVTGGGLSYRYYEGNWDGLPDFNALNPVKTGSTPNIDITVRNVNDYFGLVWEGYINIPAPGTYTFETVSDDGSKLYFNSKYSAAAQALVNNDGLHAQQAASGSVYIPAAGVYPIAMSFFEKFGGEVMQAYWSGPGITRQLIPDAAFTSNTNIQPGCSSAGSIVREEWDNVNGNDVAQVPVQSTPSRTSQLTMLETSTIGSLYGARVRGYVCPPQTGDYTFMIAGDDAVELWVSTDEDPANKKKVAYLLSWTYFHEFTKFASQKSSPINLVSGRRYYIEVLHKQGGGGDNMTVAWQLPNGVSEIPIPGSRLVPYSSTIPVVASNLPVSSKAISKEPQGQLKLGIYPNPAKGSATLQVYPAETGLMTLELYDIHGRLIKRFYDGMAEKGRTTTLAFKGDGLSNGTYIIRVNTRSAILSEKITIAR